MIDQHGNLSPSYCSVQETNRFLRQAGPALLGWDNSNVARIHNGQIEAPGECPAVSLSGDHLDLVVGTFAHGKSIRLVLANDSCENPAILRISATSDRRVQKVIASRNAKLPTDPNSPAATWSLGPAGCVLIELARSTP